MVFKRLPVSEIDIHSSDSNIKVPVKWQFVMDGKLNIGLSMGARKTPVLNYLYQMFTVPAKKYVSFSALLCNCNKAVGHHSPSSHDCVSVALGSPSKTQSLSH